MFHNHRRIMVALSVCILSAGLSAAKKRAPAMYVKPDQVAEIADASQTFASAEKTCANYAWAAAVNTLLAPDDVRLPQAHWVLRATAGDKCLAKIDDVAAFTRQVDGDYTLNNGRRIHLRTSFSPGPPDTIDTLVMALRERRSAIILLSGRAYLLQGILYDDHMRSYNDHFFIVKELRLIDPAIAPGAKGRTATFVRDKDDANVREIEGIITLTVRDLKLGELSDGYTK
jgi:hypothetical protein